jgi:hypothetical protein
VKIISCSNCGEDKLFANQFREERDALKSQLAEKTEYISYLERPAISDQRRACDILEELKSQLATSQTQCRKLERVIRSAAQDRSVSYEDFLEMHDSPIAGEKDGDK